MTSMRSVVEYYERKLERYGPSPQGMDWKDEASQDLRFQLLCEIGDLTGRSLHEIGAGAGHLYAFLRKRGIEADYSGSDLSPAMVEAARRLHPGVRFTCSDVLRDSSRGAYDVVVCSGLFYVKIDHAESEWRDFVRALIRRMYAMCRIGIAFNLMSDQVDFRNPHLFYESPESTLEFCRRELSRSVTIRHDYPLYEYTTYVYRDGKR